jgi:hypothetical protein
LKVVVTILHEFTLDVNNRATFFLSEHHYPNVAGLESQATTRQGVTLPSGAGSTFNAKKAITPLLLKEIIKTKE